MFSLTRAEKLDQHLRDLVQGAATSFVLRSAGAGIEFALSLVLARMLGAEGAGIYFLALTIHGVASVFGRIGLDNALVRHTASHAASGDWAAVKGVYRQGMRLAITSSAVCAAALWGISPWLAHNVLKTPGMTEPLRWMALAVVPAVMLILHGEMLRGLKRIAHSQLIESVLPHALALGGTLLLAQHFGVNGAVLAYLAAGIVTAVAAVTLWHMATPQLRSLVGRFDTRTLLKSSFPLFWAKSLNLAKLWMATFAVGLWGTPADVGIFSVAARTVLLASLVLMAVNSIAGPKFAALYQLDDRSALQSTARAATRLMLVVATPIFIFFLAAPDWVMGWFGPQFARDGAVVLVILAFGQLVNVATGSVGYLLMMTGHERDMRNTVALSLAVSATLNLLLVPSMGAVGAAIATASSVATANLSGLYLVHLRLGITTNPLGIR